MMGLSAPGRLLELPVLHPNVHLGSVYLWYDQLAQRERPGGYSTIAPRPAARLSLRLAELNCGDWRPGDDALLRRLGVRYVAFHRGLAGETGWFAWRELLGHGFGRVARDDGVTMLERGRSGGSSPVAEPSKRVVFCEGWHGGSPRYRHAAFWARGQIASPSHDPGARARDAFDRQKAGALAARRKARLGSYRPCGLAADRRGRDSRRPRPADQRQAR